MTIMFFSYIVLCVNAAIPSSGELNRASIAHDFLLKETPNANIRIINERIYRHPETGINYTYVLSKINRRKKGVVVDHRTNKVFSPDKIKRDYQDYVESLPQPYRKLSPMLRGEIKKKYNNSFPDPEKISFDEDFEVILYVNNPKDLIQITKEVVQISEFPDVINEGQNRIIVTRLPLSKIFDFSNRDAVETIWFNAPAYGSLNFSISEVNGDQLYDLGYYGDGSKVAVFDSGITKSHPNINESLIISEMNFYTSKYPQNYTDDDHGHGTHVSGIIASNNDTFRGMAYKSTIINAKVLDNNKNGLSNFIIDAILYYTNKSNVAPDTDIIQMSINTGSNPDGTSQLSRVLDQSVFLEGTLAVVSTGNSYSLGAPADAYNTMSVGATRYHGYANEWRVRPTSGSGTTTDIGSRTKVDVVAPGEDIYSANNQWSSGDRFVKKSGTSMAAPHVSGLSSLLYQYARDNNKSVNPLLVKAAILNSAIKVKNQTGSNWSHNLTSPLDLSSGAGQIDALEAYNTLSNTGRLFASNMTSTGDLDYYKVVITDAPVNLTATLVWNRHEKNYLSANFSDVNDLDIILWNDEDEILVTSESEYDNVEHIFYEITSNGTYEIEIEAWNISKTDGWEYYALALSHKSIASYEDNLKVGWNLISIHLTPENSSVGAVLESIEGNYSIVWMYNASDTQDPWKRYIPGSSANDLDNIYPGFGYWIRVNSTTDKILTIDYEDG